MSLCQGGESARIGRGGCQEGEGLVLCIVCMNGEDECPYNEPDGGPEDMSPICFAVGETGLFAACFIGARMSFEEVVDCSRFARGVIGPLGMELEMQFDISLLIGV